MMALSGLRVLELEGIGGGPLTGCILADFGAEVITISRVSAGKLFHQGDPVARGKKSIGLDLKSPAGMEAMKELLKTGDIFIDPFRPGVTEKIGLGPQDVEAINPRVIYARLTGWGQGGDPKIEKSAGHDANYLALSGALDLWRRGTVKDAGQERPQPPANFAGDYAGGGLMCAIGILLAVKERRSSGKGQVVDCAMLDGAAYIAWPTLKGQANARPGGAAKDKWGDQKLEISMGANHYVNVYQTKPDPRRPDRIEYVSVQAIEAAFYRALLKGLGLDKAPDLPKQNDREGWPMMRKKVASIFMTKTRDEWCEVFRGTDACFAPVLNSEEAWEHPHNKARGTFAPSASHPGKFEPAPAPHLSRTPGYNPRPDPTPGADTRTVLKEVGLSGAKIEELFKAGVTADETAQRGVFERNQPSKL